MKKLALLVPIFAAVALFAQPVFADDTHRHEKCAHAAQKGAAKPAEKMNDHESMMQESMNKMHAQMATLHQTKDPKKRQKLLQEHSKSMHDSLKMMREMMGDMAMGCDMGSGHKMCDHKTGDHKMCGHKMGSHKMDGNPVSKLGDNADATPAAQANPDPVTATDKTSANPDKKLWVCPMHPDVVQDHPGICPICGMDLVEMEQPGASQPGHSHMMGGGMKCGCTEGGSMKGDCMKGGGMMGDMKGGGMKGDCMMMGGGMMGDMKGGGMKGDCMMMGGSMMGGGMMGDMKGGGMKCGCMSSGGMMGDMKRQMMDMVLMLMEQMVEHNEAAMSARK